MNIAHIAQEGFENLDEHGTVIFVTGEGPDTTHDAGELHGVGIRFASALVELGIQPGDRVAVMIPNAPAITAMYHGISRMGGVVLPVLFLLAPSEVKHILADSGAKAIVTSPEFLPAVQQAAEGIETLRHVICIGDAPDGTIGFDDLVSGASGDTPIVERADEDLALLIYTGGTTGRPKGVMLSHANLNFSARTAAKVTYENMEPLGLEPGATGISALPLAHAFGVIVSLVGPKVQQLSGTRKGGKTVLLRWFDPEQYHRCIDEYACRTTAMVPTMMTYLLAHQPSKDYDVSALRSVISSAAPLPVETLKAFEERFPSAVVLESWGLTEAAPLGTSNRANDRRIGSVGKPFPGIDLKITDPETGEELPPTEPGEVCLRGPNIMQGYWNLPDETAETVKDGWLHTGDVGYVDEDGFLFIVDRVKNLIIRGGLNVYPRDVEEILHRHPAVLEAAVIGVPHPEFGEEVEAFVVKQDVVEEDELLAWCRESLAKYKSPKRIHFIDVLPKSGVGKILHRELRDEAKRRTEGTNA